jgi:hypothetical protein
MRVRGCLRLLSSRRLPLTRRYAPTSPRKRGEVEVRLAREDYPSKNRPEAMRGRWATGQL